MYCVHPISQDVPAVQLYAQFYSPTADWHEAATLATLYKCTPSLKGYIYNLALADDTSKCRLLIFTVF